MGNRHEAREWALQFLFQSEFNRDESIDEGFKLFWEHQNEEAAPPAAQPAAKEEEPAGRGRKNVQQSELQLGAASDRGRFRDVAPTIYEGADLDIPVYSRRGIRIPT